MGASDEASETGRLRSADTFLAAESPSGPPAAKRVGGVIAWKLPGGSGW